MRKLLLGILASVLIIGLFAGIGYAGYRFGYARGAQLTADGGARQLRLFDDVGPGGSPMHNFGSANERGFDRGLGPDGFRRMSFGFFSPILFLGSIAVLGLVLWFIYGLFARSGWQLTRTPPVTETTPLHPERENQNTEANE